jgi:hypothetical protein
MMPLGALAALLLAALLAAATYAWLLAGGVLWRPRQVGRRGQDVQAAFRRHPAARSRGVEYVELAPAARKGAPGAQRPVGPDDDPEFISALERMIRGVDPEP